MVADHLVDYEAQELLAEIGVEIGIAGQRAQPGDLLHLAHRVGGGQAVLGLVATDRLGHLEPLGEHEDQRGVDIVDALAIAGKRLIRHGVPDLAR